MDTAAPSEELAQLATLHGVATDYWSWQGQHVVVSADGAADTEPEQTVPAAVTETTLVPAPGVSASFVTTTSTTTTSTTAAPSG